MAIVTTPNIGLNLIGHGQQGWDTALNQNFEKIDFTMNDLQAKLGSMTIDGGDFGDTIINGIILDGGDF